MRSRKIHLGLLVVACALFATAAASLGRPDNGFDLTDALTPTTEIHPGGPARDGIPSIDHPNFVVAREATYLADEDRVLGLQHNGETKAYPIRILSQLMMQAITGPARRTKLNTLPVIHTTWRAWRREHPRTLVLSNETGFDRDYSVSPYFGYETEESVYFPLRNRSNRYHAKETVLGIESDGVHKAYPFTELARHERTAFADEINGRPLTIHFDARNQTARARDDKGRLLPATLGLWFAWFAFHPDTEVFRAAP